MWKKCSACGIDCAGKKDYFVLCDTCEVLRDQFRENQILALRDLIDRLVSIKLESAIEDHFAKDH